MIIVAHCFCEESICPVCYNGKLFNHECGNTECRARFCSDCHGTTNKNDVLPEMQCKCFVREPSKEE